MLDQNTDRMWFVIGAVIVGAATIFIANGTLPDIFASVTESFNNVAGEAVAVMEGIEPQVENDSRLRPIKVHNSQFEDGLSHWIVRAGDSNVAVTTTMDETYGQGAKVTATSNNLELGQGIWQSFHGTERQLEAGKVYRMEVVIRADEPMEVGIGFDGQYYSNLLPQDVGTGWVTYVVEQVTTGSNTQPRIYAGEAGTYYIADVRMFEEVASLTE